MVGVLIGSYVYEPNVRALPVLVAWSTIVLLFLELLVQAKTSIGVRIKSLLQNEEDNNEFGNVPISRA